MFDEIRLPQESPVYVSHAEATAYAKWLGRKLPTEARFIAPHMERPTAPASAPSVG